MTARDNVLSNLKEPNDPDQEHKDVEAAFRVAEAESGSNGCKSCKPLQADRSLGDGPPLNRPEGEDRNGEDKQPCDPAEENLECHVGGFSRLQSGCAWLFCALVGCSHVFGLVLRPRDRWP